METPTPNPGDDPLDVLDDSLDVVELDDELDVVVLLEDVVLDDIVVLLDVVELDVAEDVSLVLDVVLSASETLSVAVVSPPLDCGLMSTETL